MRTPNQRTTVPLAHFGLAVLAAMALFTSGCAIGRGTNAKATRIEKVRYHGWSNAIRLWSPAAEVVVVPATGRVMSFRLVGREKHFLGRLFAGRKAR
jgi:hypothetical protein